MVIPNPTSGHLALRILWCPEVGLDFDFVLFERLTCISGVVELAVLNALKVVWHKISFGLCLV